MTSCSNRHLEIFFTEETKNCPLCVMWSEYGKLVIQIGELQKQIEKRSKVDEAVKIIHSTLEKQEKIIENIELALSEFSIRNLEMNGRNRHTLTVDGQERAYNILKTILDNFIGGTC